MIYAQILNGIIVNIIQLDDSTLVSLFAQGYDSCLQIDNLTVVPNIGWYYDITSLSFYPPITLALIQNGSVTQIIQNCEAYITNNSSNYQYIIDVTTVNPQPLVGDLYDGTTFTHCQAYYQALVNDAISFGNQLITQFAAENVSEGITQAGQTLAILTYTQSLFMYLQSGSLYLAIGAIETMIADTSSTKTSLSPFITNDILYSYLNEIQNWLEIPITSNPGS
jgi:hypothetical protein